MVLWRPIGLLALTKMHFDELMIEQTSTSSASRTVRWAREKSRSEIRKVTASEPEIRDFNYVIRLGCPTPHFTCSSTPYIRAVCGSATGGTNVQQKKRYKQIYTRHPSSFRETLPQSLARFPGLSSPPLVSRPCFLGAAFLASSKKALTPKGSAVVEEPVI